MFISFEGIDGSGKSTQVRRLGKTLQDRGHSVVVTREPGGSPGAEEIRRLLVQGGPDRWSAETELLLFPAARRDHVERLIRPALERGDTVITDRFADSTRVYQGATRGNLRTMVDQLHDLVIGIDPDLTFVIDMDPELALSRSLVRQSGEDRFEDMGLDFQRRLREGFRRLAETQPRVRLIDGQGNPDEVASRVLAALP